MSSANWWARKLGTPAPAAANNPPSRPVQSTLPAFRSPSTPPAQVTKDNIVEAASLWQGGAGTATEITHCPNCGSPNYFSRSNQALQNPNHTGAGPSITTDHGVMHVASRCFECNYSSATAHPSLQ